MSSLSEGDEEKEIDILTCPICLNTLNKPRQLECLHNFCHKCLQEYISSSGENGEHGKGKFICPVCKIPCRVPFPEKPRNKWATQFPTDSLVTSLADSASLKTDSQTCAPCKREGKHSEAKFWCRDCFEAMCDSCKLIHKKIRQIKSHKILRLEEVRSSPQILKMVEGNVDCTQHTKRQIELFCRQHRKLCCVVCFATDHRECPDVKTIDELVKDEKSEGELTEIIEAMKEVMNRAEEQISHKTQTLTLMTFKHEELAEKIESITRKAIERLKSLRNEAIEKFEICHSKETKRIEYQRDILQSSKLAMKMDLKYLEAVTKYGSPKQVFITSEKIRHQVGFHREILTVDQENHEDVDYKFEFNEIVEDLSHKLSALGKLKVLRNSLDEMVHDNDRETGMKSVTFSIAPNQAPTRLSVKTYSTATPSSRPHTLENCEASRIRMRKEKDYDGSMGSDRKISWFTGGTFCLDNGQFIMADYNNHKLKRFKRDVYSPIMEYPVESAPFDIALVQDDEILVSFPHECRINRYKLRDDDILKQTDTITTLSPPEGVAFVDQNIVASFSNCIKIMDEYGKEVVNIPTKESSAYTIPIVASKTGNTFVHRDGNVIVIRSLDGDEIFRFRHRQLKDPSGISMDFKDNIYVCDCNSSNIYQISADGQRGRIIRSSRLCVGRPVGIGFDGTGKRLWLTSNIQRSGQLLTMYTLSC
ncbi:hypothetical protein FSP39_010646 [Pinctada imbricata]|uniref:Uncharacterized protein n=1 Tax=Pinctada imbricata TaxID=66713 RepID=A0AA89BYG3_PINIB|nr:hypothetical protein FSP39_010646 [Pinctada imbricata]